MFQTNFIGFLTFDVEDTKVLLNLMKATTKQHKHRPLLTFSCTNNKIGNLFDVCEPLVE